MVYYNGPDPLKLSVDEIVEALGTPEVNSNEVYNELINQLKDLEGDEEWANKLTQLCKAVDQEARGGVKKPEKEIREKLMGEDPTYEGEGRKPGEMEELVEVLQKQEGKPPQERDVHLVADETADNVYYIFQLPDEDEKRQLFETLSDITGWNRNQLLQIAVVKYGVRVPYGRKAFQHTENPKESAKVLEKTVMDRYISDNPELQQNFNPSSDAQNRLQALMSSYGYSQ